MGIHEEVDRLRERWLAAGGDRQEFEAYREGATHEQHLAEIREKLERLEAGEAEPK